MYKTHEFIAGYKLANDSTLAQYGIFCEYWSADDIVTEMTNVGVPYLEMTEEAWKSIMDIIKRNYTKEVGINTGVIRAAILTYCQSNEIELQPKEK